ncbi:MAG TPA: PilZ domain-containing protein [Terriglobales bacterium]|nr:PilZ domain-containing protein [Terriglobales bacterium]
MAPKTQLENSSTPVRRWHRFRFDVPVRVVLRRNARDLEFTGRGTAMNEGGIALDLDASLQVGNLVQVEFTPPYAGLPVRVQGAVRNVEGTRYGVEFLAADAAEQQEVGLFRQMLRTAADRLGE